MLDDPIRRIIFTSNFIVGKNKIIFRVPVIVSYDGINIYIEDIISEELFIEEPSLIFNNESIIIQKIIDLLNEGQFNTEIRNFCLYYF